MKATLAALVVGLAAVAAIPAPAQNDERFVSVSIVDEATYHHPGIYEHSITASGALLSIGPTVTVTVTSTVTTSVATATTTKYVTRPCDDFA